MRLMIRNKKKDEDMKKSVDKQDEPDTETQETGDPLAVVEKDLARIFYFREFDLMGDKASASIGDPEYQFIRGRIMERNRILSEIKQLFEAYNTRLENHSTLVSATETNIPSAWINLSGLHKSS